MGVAPGKHRKCIECGERHRYKHLRGVRQACDGRPRYVDESGRLWHGLKCPECRVKACKEAVKRRRARIR